jgi:hypothetical protein
MPGRKSNNEYRESEYSKDLEKIMAAGKSPFTRSMLAKGLMKLYPEKYWRDLMMEVSGALLMDRLSKAKRFRPVTNKKGWYELNKL